MKINISYPNWENIESEYLDNIQKTKYTILYFYPKDSTPWCSREADDFNKLKSEFNKLNCQIIWVSKDSHKSHCKFINKFELDFPLISDEDLALHKEFDVWHEKKFMWKVYMGTIRTTFLLDNDNKIVKIYPDVSVTNHANQVLSDLQNIVG